MSFRRRQIGAAEKELTFNQTCLTSNAVATGKDIIPYYPALKLLLLTNIRGKKNNNNNILNINSYNNRSKSSLKETPDKAGLKIFLILLK